MECALILSQLEAGNAQQAACWGGMTGVEPAHLGCFVKYDSSVLDVPVALVELGKGDPQRVQLANSLHRRGASVITCQVTLVCPFFDCILSPLG